MYSTSSSSLNGNIKKQTPGHGHHKKVLWRKWSCNVPGGCSMQRFFDSAALSGIYNAFLCSLTSDPKCNASFAATTIPIHSILMGNSHIQHFHPALPFGFSSNEVSQTFESSRFYKACDFPLITHNILSLHLLDVA